MFFDWTIVSFAWKLDTCFWNNRHRMGLCNFRLLASLKACIYTDDGISLPRRKGAGQPQSLPWLYKGRGRKTGKETVGG